MGDKTFPLPSFTVILELYIFLFFQDDQDIVMSVGDVTEQVMEVDETMDLNKAIQEVLKTANKGNGLQKGIRQTVQALDRREALLILLATNVDDANYSRLIEALCTEHNIKLLKVDSNKTLGEWCGLCKYDREGNPRRVVGCGAVAVTDYGIDESPALTILEDHFKN